MRLVINFMLCVLLAAVHKAQKNDADTQEMTVVSNSSSSAEVLLDFQPKRHKRKTELPSSTSIISSRSTERHTNTTKEGNPWGKPRSDVSES